MASASRGLPYEIIRIGYVAKHISQAETTEILLLVKRASFTEKPVEMYIFALLTVLFNDESRKALTEPLHIKLRMGRYF